MKNRSTLNTKSSTDAFLQIVRNSDFIPYIPFQQYTSN